MENYKEKIKKLLALSESSNEHEAKAALLKAKQLMVEHKIAESDLTDGESVVKKIKSDVTYSARRDPWIPLLADTLARNYLCQFVRFSRKGMQTKGVGFWGLEDDAEICTKVFEYAVDCIRSECKKIKKENANSTAQTRNCLCSGYAFGFILGLEEAFKEQEESNKAKWGLVPMMSEEVAHSTDGLRKIRSSSFKASEVYKAVGYSAGKNFNMGNRVAAN